MHGVKKISNLFENHIFRRIRESEIDFHILERKRG